MKNRKSILLNLELKQYNQVRNYAFKNKTTMSNVIREAIKKLKLDFPIFETSQPLFDTGFGEDTYSKEAQEVYNKFVDLMEDLIK